METELVRPKITRISLPNYKKNKKINLHELYFNLKSNESFKASYDTDSNPKQNWVSLNIVGQAKIFSNGTVVTDLALPDEALIIFFDRLYSAYIKEVIK